MKTIREIIQSTCPDQITTEIILRMKNHPRAHIEGEILNTQKALRRLKNFPFMGTCDTLSVCYMGFSALDEDDYEYVPIFLFYKIEELKQFRSIREFEQISLWNRTPDREHIDDLTDFQVLTLLTIRIIPEPIPNRTVSEFPARLNALVFAQPGFHDIDLVLEFLELYRDKAKNTVQDSSGNPREIIGISKMKRMLLKNQIILYQQLKAACEQLFANPTAWRS